MSYDDGLGLLAGGNEFGHDASVVQNAAGTGKRSRGRAKTINKVTFVVSRQPGGGYAATGTVGGGIFGGGQKKQFTAPDIGSLLTQLGASARKAFSFGVQPQYAPMQPQQYPQPQQYIPPQPQYPPQQPQYAQRPPPQQVPQPQQYVPQASPAPAGGKVCANCGAGISEASAFCGSCGTKYLAPVPKDHYCGQCGSKVEATKAFCSTCGTKQT